LGAVDYEAQSKVSTLATLDPFLASLPLLDHILELGVHTLVTDILVMAIRATALHQFTVDSTTQHTATVAMAMAATAMEATAMAVTAMVATMEATVPVTLHQAIDLHLCSLALVTKGASLEALAVKM
jgi:hypothetical protein